MPVGGQSLRELPTLRLVGMLQELKPRAEAQVLSLVIYALMGWVALVAVASLGPAGFAWLLAGGICYTVGIVFFVFDERFRHWHGVWHLCVIGGSALHVVTVQKK